MADDSLSLHIDTDWKKQAQAEKRRLAEEQKQREQPPAAPARAAPAAPASTGGRERPQAGFGAVVQLLVTQTLYYLGEIASAGGEAVVSFDLARFQLDNLAALEEKTAGNLTDDERRALDVSLYEARARFIAAAARHVM